MDKFGDWGEKRMEGRKSQERRGEGDRGRPSPFLESPFFVGVEERGVVVPEEETFTLICGEPTLGPREWPGRGGGSEAKNSRKDIPEAGRASLGASAGRSSLR